MDLSDIEKLVNILGKSDITDFKLEADGFTLRLSRSTGLAVSGGASTTTQYYQGEALSSTSSGTTSGNLTVKQHTHASDNQTPNSKEAEVKGVRVESPIVGTFYRKPSPDAPSFVSQGDTVKKGQTLCIVEAMKLMNEIPSPVDGKIQEILLQDGQVVEFGEVMFIIEP